MKKSILETLILAGSILATSSQGQEPCTARSKILRLGDRPSVYLSYDGMAARSRTTLRLAEGLPSAKTSNSTDTKSAPNVVLLRLHNNTFWTIVFPTESLYVGPAVTGWRLCDGTGVLGLQEGIEVNGRYEVELLEDRKHPMREGSKGLIDYLRTDVFSSSWLPSGRSVVIAIPKEHLNKGFAIYIPFNYEWETVKGVVRGDEAQHRVYFYFWNLPEQK
jgi:hypothetical protein